MQKNERATMKRLRKELQLLRDEPDPDIALGDVTDDMKKWRTIIKGPEDSPYAGGTFELVIDIGHMYPFAPPNIRFATRVFHPNVHFETGEICLDILKSQWSPAWGIQASCRAITALLSGPAADSPLNCDAGNMIRAGDDLAFENMARMYTLEYAM